MKKVFSAKQIGSNVGFDNSFSQNNPIGPATALAHDAMCLLASSIGVYYLKLPTIRRYKLYS